MQRILILLFSISGALAARECCPPNQPLRRRGYCGENDTSLTRMINMNCTSGHMLLRDIILKGDKVTTQDSPEFTFAEDPNLYCVAKSYRNESDIDLGTVPVAVVCFDSVDQRSDIETTGILTLISVLFLGLTLAVYIYLPQLRDLQGLCYTCMCISMALGFLSLGILQLGSSFKVEICTVVGFLVYFWMIATFFWMNVICINMYRSIENSNYLKKTQRKQYFWYSCYGWGSTFLFLMVALIANSVEGKHWKPGFGQYSCWFSGRTETWIFFYGPVAVLITANVLLFFVSSIKLWNQSRQYEVNTLNNLKHKFLLSLKLFLVMGISWIFEIASFAHGESHFIWQITDTFNCLQGVIIFLLLVVCRRRAMQGLANENICLPLTKMIAEKLSPHDDADDREALADDNMEVRLG